MNNIPQGGNKNIDDYLDTEVIIESIQQTGHVWGGSQDILFVDIDGKDYEIPISLVKPVYILDGLSSSGEEIAS